MHGHVDVKNYIYCNIKNLFYYRSNTYENETNIIIKIEISVYQSHCNNFSSVLASFNLMMTL